METLKAISLRKSTRSFRPEQIPEDALNKILAAGCAAPVGRKRYDSLHLTVIRNKNVLKKISASAMRQFNSNTDPIYDVPTLIVISSSDIPESSGIKYANASCVAENMLLAATDSAIGSVYLWGAPIAIKSDKDLMQDLNIPADFEPIAAVGLGYPTESNSQEKELKITISMNKI
jgi:nitroreductase